MKKKDRSDTILTAMTPTTRSYKHELGQLLSSPDFLSPEECEQIITEFGDDVEPGMITEGEDGVVHTSYRSADIAMIAPNPQSFQFMDKALNLMMQANERFEFEIDHFEGFQLTRYGVGGHYNWHKDIGVGRAGHRKLSMTVQLSSPADYEGGELQIIDSQDTPYVADKRQGSVIVFPSWERHRVTPITKGERWALVTWASGHSRFR